MNNAAIDKGVASIVKVEVPASWSEAKDEAAAVQEVPAFVTDILEPMNRSEGDKLPISVFMKHKCEDGTFPTSTTRYEKRGVAAFVPQWHHENCIQCNRCSFVCPHAAIRPILLDESEKMKAPETFETIPAIGKELKGLAYRMQVSPLIAKAAEVVSWCARRKKSFDFGTDRVTNGKRSGQLEFQYYRKY